MQAAESREERLARVSKQLKEDQTTPYDKNNPEHEALLTRLWKTSFPDTELSSRYSEQWKWIGFQGTDPATDFRGMGLFGLKQLLYFAEKKNQRWRELLAASERRKERMYPVAVAGINITFMLFHEVFTAQPPAALRKSAPTVDRQNVDNLIADDPNALNEIYCTVFEQFDALWDEASASYMDFPKVMTSLRTLVTTIFVQPLGNLMDFRSAVLHWKRDRLLLPATVTEEFSSLIANQDINKMLMLQHDTLHLMHTCNMTVDSFNTMWAASYANFAKDFDRYTRLLRTLKEDMDNIFRRIRVLHTKVAIPDIEEREHASQIEA